MGWSNRSNFFTSFLSPHGFWWIFGRHYGSIRWISFRIPYWDRKWEWVWGIECEMCVTFMISDHLLWYPRFRYLYCILGKERNTTWRRWGPQRDVTDMFQLSGDRRERSLRQKTCLPALRIQREECQRSEEHTFPCIIYSTTRSTGRTGHPLRYLIGRMAVREHIP